MRSPAIAPRPKDVGDTAVQGRLAGRDVASIGAALPVPQARPVELSIDDCRFSIEQWASNRKSKIDNRKFPGGFMIPCQGGLAGATGSSRGDPLTIEDFFSARALTAKLYVVEC